MESNHNQSKPIIKAASACVWRGESVLLVQRGQGLGHGLWSLPGGRLEAGETAEQAALRELREETGIATTLPFHVADFPLHTPAAQFVISCFTGFYQSGEALAASDAVAVCWQPWRQLSALKLTPHIETAVALARKFTSV